VVVVQDWAVGAKRLARRARKIVGILH